MTRSPEGEAGHTLTEAQVRILYGLSIAHSCSISATEMAELDPLVRAGLVECWQYSSGIHVWQITDSGRAALAKARPGR